VRAGMTRRADSLRGSRQLLLALALRSPRLCGSSKRKDKWCEILRYAQNDTVMGLGAICTVQSVSRPSAERNGTEIASSLRFLAMTALADFARKGRDTNTLSHPVIASDRRERGNLGVCPRMPRPGFETRSRDVAMASGPSTCISRREA